jgi:hypothetical protein
MAGKSRRVKAYSTRVDDYSATMSGFERESLAAEAKLRAERKNGKRKPKALTMNGLNLRKPAASGNPVIPPSATIH